MITGAPGWALVLILFAGCSSLWPAPATAHDIGTTRVDLRLAPDGSIHAEIVVDSEALVRRLDLAAGRLPDTAAPPDPGRIPALGHAFLESVEIRAAGQRVPLAFAYTPADAAGKAAQTGTVRLTGTLPAGARAFTWRYALPLGSYALRVSQPGLAAEQVLWLVGGRTSDAILLTASAVSLPSILAQYVRLGVLHIVPRGLDHILFVLCLFLLSPSWRALLAQVSAFTLAHTLTLGASVVGLISLPSGVVEPLIAGSIAWVAIENIWRPGLSRTRVVVVFLFGLLHGLGFAGVLADLGLPAAARIPALLAFNVGVELGQLSVLAAAFGATAVLLRQPARYRRWVVVPVSAVIACVGVYWTIVRLFAA